jgi:hypothetical protein
VIIDLHCHAQPRSQCSALQPEELTDLAKARGLDGLCLTDHDRFWTGEEIALLRERTKFLVFAAVELTTDAGHALGFGLGDARGVNLASAKEAHALAQRSGGLLYLAHPARDGLLRVTRDTVEYFDGVESMNGSDSRLQNLAATGLGKGFRLPGIGGSDAHGPAEVGTAATRFHAAIRTDADLVTALHAGDYEAVHLDA